MTFSRASSVTQAPPLIHTTRLQRIHNPESDVLVSEITNLRELFEPSRIPAI
jgi:hypothetical protein